MSTYYHVCITSDGSIGGTTVVDAETGEPIKGVVELQINHQAGMPPLARITLLAAIENMVFNNVEAQTVGARVN